MGPDLSPRVGSSVLRDKSVVIVEDEGLTQLQLKKICQLAGMRVASIAADGKTGVQKVLAARPDMVLLDIKMPVMDGIEAAGLVLSAVKTCVVMLTAFNLDDQRERAFSAGVTAYLLKPVTYERLVPELEEAYRRYLARGN